MDETLVFNLIDHFIDLEDPRSDRTKKHLTIPIALEFSDPEDLKIVS